MCLICGLNARAAFVGGEKLGMCLRLHMGLVPVPTSESQTFPIDSFNRFVQRSHYESDTHICYGYTMRTRVHPLKKGILTLRKRAVPNQSAETYDSRHTHSCRC